MSTWKFNTNLLTSEQQFDLLHLACMENDADAQAKLVEAYLPLVARIAHQCVLRGDDVGDLLGEGVVALTRCVERFDPTREKEFAGYASKVIKGAMMNYNRDNGTIVRTGSTAAGRKLSYGLRKAQSELGDDVPAIAKRLGVSEADVCMMGEYMVRRDAPLSVAASLQDEGLTPEEQYIEKQQREFIITSVREWGERLEGLDRRVFFERMLAENVTQAECASRLGITQQQLSKIENRLKDEMREDLEYVNHV